MSVTHVKSVSQLNGILSDSNKLTVSIGLLSLETVVNASHIGHRLPRNLVIRLAYLIRLTGPNAVDKGSKQIHTIRGADRTGLQNAVKRFTSSSSTGAFSGQGQTLGGSPPPAPNDLIATASSKWSNMDPPLKVLLGLVAVYVFFWLM
ncbi:hypothetical protein J3R82DRAFT_493 [Butyriboletus roseoflavus]|nr:hypothetical protein J3R82DRAFT_493 [Butyriboletus roseoflavus]